MGKKSKNSVRSRRFQLTINNPNGDELKMVKSIVCKYCCYCLEAAPTTGTRHMHIFVVFEAAKAISSLKKDWPRAHIELCKGSVKKNIAYIKKHGEFFEYGDIPKQGKRTDLAEIAQLIDSGADIKDIAKNHPSSFIRHPKGIQFYQALSFKERTSQPKVIWLYGSTGVGKTRTAMENTPKSFYIKDQTQWWDNYSQQQTLIIDDFDINEKTNGWPFRNLLRLLDRYPYQGQIKGGYVPINSPYIYITSEHPPRHFWSDTKLAQIMRRIKEGGGFVKRLITLQTLMESARKVPRLGKHGEYVFTDNGTQILDDESDKTIIISSDDDDQLPPKKDKEKLKDLGLSEDAKLDNSTDVDDDTVLPLARTKPYKLRCSGYHNQYIFKEKK